MGKNPPGLTSVDHDWEFLARARKPIVSTLTVSTLAVSLMRPPWLQS
jgi:hypothetical protein